MLQQLWKSRGNLCALFRCRAGRFLKKESTTPANFTLFSTGSEVSLSLDVAAALEKQGKSVRVVSMPCWEIFEKREHYTCKLYAFLYRVRGLSLLGCCSSSGKAGEICARCFDAVLGDF